MVKYHIITWLIVILTLTSVSTNVIDGENDD